MRLAQVLQTRLKEGGWTLKRMCGSHQTWHHANGARYTLPVRMNDKGRKKLNCLHDIEKLEKKSPQVVYYSRDQKCLMKSTSV